MLINLKLNRINIKINLIKNSFRINILKRIIIYVWDLMMMILNLNNKNNKNNIKLRKSIIILHLKLINYRNKITLNNFNYLKLERKKTYY